MRLAQHGAKLLLKVSAIAQTRERIVQGTVVQVPCTVDVER
jgi:hypothetical protein